MRFHEVVIRKVQRNRRLEIFDLFTEREREARQSLAMRSHGQNSRVRCSLCKLVKDSGRQ